MVVLNKCDLVEKKEIVDLEKIVKTLNQDCQIFDTILCNVPVEIMIKIRAFDLESVSHIEKFKTHNKCICGVDDQSHEHEHPHESLTNLVLEYCGFAKAKQRIENWLVKLLWNEDESMKSDMEIFRMKGVFAIESHKQKYYLQAVGDLYELEQSKSSEWDSSSESPLNRVLVIGRNLNRQYIYDGFNQIFK